jgi:SAM-dependent methyltransferase
MSSEVCRFCRKPLQHSFCDLGMTPLSNSYLEPEELHRMEPFFPLHAFVCANCYLVQLAEFESPEHIFSDYAYFSSYSASWLNHAQKYSEMIVPRLGLDGSSMVVEVASNDGYLLQNFVRMGIPALGVEPAANVAEAARERGVATTVRFFGEHTATALVAEGYAADLVIGNNVLAHVPDLNDFVSGLRVILKPQGAVTVEFPHLARLMEENQFDTIYHEHFSYFSLGTVRAVFGAHRLRVFDVEEIPTHGGSLRVYACHSDAEAFQTADAVEEVVQRETDAGLRSLGAYLEFPGRVRATKMALLDFLIRAKREGKSVAGYGAAAKGNTLLNYCGIRGDFIDYVVDRNPHKQGRFLPGTHIPIRSPDEIQRSRPDYLLILPWNLRDEIISQMELIRSWGGKFVVPIPTVQVLQ